MVPLPSASRRKGSRYQDPSEEQCFAKTADVI